MEGLLDQLSKTIEVFKPARDEINQNLASYEAFGGSNFLKMEDALITATVHTEAFKDGVYKQCLLILK